jgi:LysM repeat protein
MRSMTERLSFVLALAGAAAAQCAWGQLPPPSLSHIEPGLEKAVRWKWQVEPSAPQDWGLPLPPMALQALAAQRQAELQAQQGMLPSATPRPANAYTVQRGDALAKIARRFKITVDQLKQANGLTTNLIHIGDVLTIPPPLPPAPPKPAAPGKAGGSGAIAGADVVTLAIFLDREGFSPGPISGQHDASLDQALALYEQAHPATPDPASVLRAAKTVISEPFTTYVLQPLDFHFIAPPKAQAVSASTPAPKSSRQKQAKSTALPKEKVRYDDLISSTMLAYRSPWEFVAERFHCDEHYLRALNPQIPLEPLIGAEFRVPKVAPFEIEHAFQPPLQPAADGISAAVLDLSTLVISHNGTVIATMPLSIARPGLRGKSPWKVLDVIPRPRLVTMREPLFKDTAPKRIYGRDDPDATPVPTATPLAEPEYLPPGPRNPVGIFWIRLGKDGDSTPLPYGLTGTSIPDHMQTSESVGGLRLSNWDISRAVRLLPAGTALEWKQSGPIAPGRAAPAAAVAQPAQPVQPAAQ